MSFTYSELWKQSGIVAMHFLNAGLRAKDKLIVLYPNTAVVDYLIAYLACLIIGVKPVSVYPPSPESFNEDLKQLTNLQEEMHSDLVITTLEYKTFAQTSSVTQKWPKGIKNWFATDVLAKRHIALNESIINYRAVLDDIEGMLYFTGRSKDAMTFNCNNIYPIDMMDLCQNHLNIFDRYGFRNPISPSPKDAMLLKEKPLTARQTILIQKCVSVEETMAHYFFLKIVGVFMLIVVLAFCAIPSFSFYWWVKSSNFASTFPGLVRPLVTSFCGGPGLLLAIVPLPWMMTLTVMVILLKWIVVGTYVQSSHKKWSPTYFRWWFVDRLVAVWECFVGCFLLDTPYLNLCYIAMGSKIDSRSTRLKLFIREFDLFTAESNTCIGGIISCRVVDAKGLVMRKVRVERDTMVIGRSSAYPGDSISYTKPASESLRTSRNVKMFFWLQLQRCLSPIFIILGYVAVLYLWSWIYLHCVFNDQRLAYDAVRLVIVFYGINIILLGLCGVLARSNLGSRTAKYVGMLCLGTVGHWVKKAHLLNIHV